MFLSSHVITSYDPLDFSYCFDRFIDSLGDYEYSAQHFAFFDHSANKICYVAIIEVYE